MNLSRAIFPLSALASVAVFAPALCSLAASGHYGSSVPIAALGATLLLILATSATITLCLRVALGVPVAGLSVRFLVSCVAALSATLLAALAFAPLALLAKVMAPALPTVSRPMSQLEHFLFLVAIHQYTATALLVLLPALAVFVYLSLGIRRPAAAP